MKALVMVAMLSTACTQPGSDARSTVERTSQGPSLPVDDSPIDGGRGFVADAGQPDGGAFVLSPSAFAQRLTVEQLRTSIPIIAGTTSAGAPIVWTLSGNRVALSAMADILGEPDWINSTSENLDPSPLYAKLMDDAARDVCGKILAADATRTDAGTRVLNRYADVDQNLRYLKLRFHGIKVSDTDTTTLQPLRTMLSSATTPTEGFRAVCVALMTDPEFNLY